MPKIELLKIHTHAGVEHGAGAVIDEQRFELLTRYIALALLVICQVSGRMFIDVGIDVLGCLLAADIEGVAQVIGSQPAFPLQHYLQQAKA